MKKSIFILPTFLMLFLCVDSQEYQQMISSGQFTVRQIQDSAESYFENKDKGRGTGYKSYKRWEYNALRMQDESGLLKSPSFYFNELERYNSYKNNTTQLSRTRRVENWEQLGPYEWNQRSGWNPGVGRITSIGIDPNNENHMIVGSPTGGVWKTTDGSANWTVLTDNLSNINVYALTIHPTNSNIYFWGTVRGIIFKSTDAGTTWNVLADTGNGDVNKILIDPTNTSKMFCSTDLGIYKSVDSGENWSLIHSDSNCGYDVEFKPGNTNIIYASGNSVFKSLDGGVSFEKIQNNSLSSWTQDYVSGTTDWIKAAANQNYSILPKSGSNLALFYYNQFTGPLTKLISPQLDLSSSTAPELKFSYSNVNWDGDIDELKVFYKTGINQKS